MLRYLLDTSIVSSPVSKLPDPVIVGRLAEHGPECAIAAPVWHELVFGCRRLPRGKRRSGLEAYLDEVVRATFPISRYRRHRRNLACAGTGSARGAGAPNAVRRRSDCRDCLCQPVGVGHVAHEGLRVLQGAHRRELGETPLRGHVFHSSIFQDLTPPRRGQVLKNAMKKDATPFHLIGSMRPASSSVAARPIGPSTPATTNTGV